MRRFWNCASGNMAVVFGIGIIPVLGAVGVAIDYSRAISAKSLIQAESDSYALSAVQLGSDGDHAHLEAHFRHATAQRLGNDWLDQLEINARWLDQSDFQVDVRGMVPTTILGAIPGYADAVRIDTVSTARIAEPKWIHKEPEIADLDPEASDYNRIYVYCFDDAKKSDPDTKGRKQMIPMADNAGTVYSEFAMPQCEAGQYLSYRLMNVRNARTKPHLWDATGPGVERYDYYTDTVYEEGMPQYDLGGWDILETVLCNNLNECRPESEGGIIPEGEDRIPERASKPCEPGKYMYYGWEDRPPGMGWTDRDYDDIRVIVECPVMEEVGERSVRLVR